MQRFKIQREVSGCIVFQRAVLSEGTVTGKYYLYLSMKTVTDSFNHTAQKAAADPDSMLDIHTSTQARVYTDIHIYHIDSLHIPQHARWNVRVWAQYAQTCPCATGTCVDKSVFYTATCVCVCQKCKGLEKLIPSAWLLQLQKLLMTIGWLASKKAGNLSASNTLY